MENKKIGFVTSLQYKDLFQEEFQILKLLREKGIDAKPLVWNDKNVNWKQYHLLILRQKKKKKNILNKKKNKKRNKKRNKK